MSTKEEEQKEEIKKTIVIDASPEVVFKAITDPNELTNWFPDQAILEPNVGGKIKFSFYRDSKSTHRNMDYFPEGTIIEFIPDKKISYSWEHPSIPDFPRTVVTWELQKIENNKTRLNLIHTGFNEAKMPKAREEHDEGWTYFLGELAKYCKQSK
jgi:uncharacterized protein YndB with AHSA1/START domain